MDNKNLAVKATSIAKTYKIYSSPKDKILDLLLPKGIGKEFKALKDINFEVRKGEIIGLIGLNGAGKSTLSNIIGGISIPSSGEIQINGESSIIAIGLGLNNFLTGIENINVKATMMGYKKEEINKIINEVIEFAEIGDFINQPIRTYSSGMRARLGFGIAIHMNPDILIIDEALSVGDPTFTNKCIKVMNEFKKNGKTIFFVSHSMPQIREFCTKAMWLEYGCLKEFGDVNIILPKYGEYINKINSMTDDEKQKYKEEVLKVQNHDLLVKYEHKFLNFKKIDYTGNIFKKIILKKENTFKSIIFNIDIYTIFFGFIPSIFRGDISSTTFISVSQGINLFIVEWPIAIISNFLITSIFSIMTGKRYVKKLISKKDFSISNMEEKINFINKKKEKELNIIREKEKLEKEFKIKVIEEEIETLKEINAKKNKELIQQEEKISKENYKKFMENEALRKNKLKCITDKEKLLYEQKIKKLQYKIDILLEKEKFKEIQTSNEFKRKLLTIENTNNKKRKSIKKKRKKELILISIAIISLITGGVYYSYETAKNNINNNKIEEEISIPVIKQEYNKLNLNNFVHLVLNKSNNDKVIVDNLTLFDYQYNENKLSITVYPGDLLLKGENGKTIKETLNYENIEDIKKILFENFGCEINDYAITIIENNTSAIEYHTKTLNELKINGIVKDNFEKNVLASSIHFDDFEKFYNEIKLKINDIQIKAVEYKEITLEEYCRVKNLYLPKDFTKEHVFIYTDESVIDSSLILTKVKQRQ
ncbi:MAG: ATP-binding cassette domain-containing protein [Sarcina sp.]